MDFRNSGMDSAKSAVDEVTAKYKGASEEELLGEIAAKVATAKADGTFNTADFTRFYNTVAPFLNAEQVKKLQAIFKELNV